MSVSIKSIWKSYWDRAMAAENQAEYRQVRKDLLVFEYVKKLEAEGMGACGVLYLKLSALQSQTLNSANRQALQDTFVDFAPEAKVKVFELHNEDLLVVYGKNWHDEILSCLVKIRFLLHDDPMLKNADDLEQSGLAQLFMLPEQKKNLSNLLQEIISETQNMVSAKSLPKIVPISIFNTSNKKVKRGLSPEMLAKVQKILSVADFSSFIRRQSVCAIIGKSVPQRVFEEVYVSIPDLREMLLPDVDLTSNPWLFLSLSETLDKRVLETISRHDDGSLIGNFSVNINVSTILSDDFLEFDDNINVSVRSSIILELQLVDIFSDIKAFILAKTFAQARGYKVCIDGITVDKLKYLNRTNLGCDLIKIIWHPSFLDVIHEDRHFMDYVNKAERAKMILCRIDDPQAIEVGNSLGINLYQGRYVQRLLSQRSNFSFKK